MEHFIKRSQVILNCYIKKSKRGTHFTIEPISIEIVLVVNYISNRNMMASSNGSLFRVTGPLCVEFTHRSPEPYLMFPLICSWTNGWVNHRDAGDLRRQRAYHEVTVMVKYNNKTGTGTINIFHYAYWTAAASCWLSPRKSCAHQADKQDTWQIKMMIWIIATELFKWHDSWTVVACANGVEMWVPETNYSQSNFPSNLIYKGDIFFNGIGSCSKTL